MKIIYSYSSQGVTCEGMSFCTGPDPFSRHSFPDGVQSGWVKIRYREWANETSKQPLPFPYFNGNRFVRRNRCLGGQIV